MIVCASVSLSEGRCEVQGLDADVLQAGLIAVMSCGSLGRERRCTA
jgi:hypothetical protein